MSDAETRSTVSQKTEWLLNHRIFLIGKTDLKKIVRAMKHDGLIAKSTYWPDASRCIEEAIRYAKLRWYAEHNGKEISI